MNNSLETIKSWLFSSYEDIESGIQMIRDLKYENHSDEEWEKLVLNYEETLLDLMEIHPNPDTIQETLYLKPENREDSPFFEVYSIQDGVEYGIDFRPWSEVLGISAESFKTFPLPKHEIIAHFLIELTFDGFTEKEMLSVREEIMSRLDEHYSEED